MPDTSSTKAPLLQLKRIVFSDGTSVDMEPGTRLILVGPNNVGKSAALNAINAKVANEREVRPVVSELETVRVGTAEDIADWAATWAKRDDRLAPNSSFGAFNFSAHISNIRDIWELKKKPLGGLARWFCHYATGDERLTYSNEQEAIDLGRERPSHPVHFLYGNRSLELKVSAEFRCAFGVDLVVNRHAGKTIRLHVGDRPELESDENPSDLSYVEKISQLPWLRLQGHGMRSFASVLLATSAARESIVLIDEPEAFLHPPHAKILGQLLSRDRADERQLVVSTHSADVLRGFLDLPNSKIQVVRLSRTGNVTHVSKLEYATVKEVWGDSLLRHSNVLDGLFHDRVVLCEGDADCRFFSALLERVGDQVGEGCRFPDTMFINCGGMHRMPMVLRSLRSVGVPVEVIADFDILRDTNPLKAIVESLGGRWCGIDARWRTLKDSVAALQLGKSTGDVRIEILRELESCESSEPPARDARENIKRILKESTAWGLAKKQGISILPSGEPRAAWDYLYSEFERLGLHILPVGEVESFVGSVKRHGPGWVGKVLSTMDLAEDPELEEARAFVRVSLIDPQRPDPHSQR